MTPLLLEKFSIFQSFVFTTFVKYFEQNNEESPASNMKFKIYCSLMKSKSYYMELKSQIENEDTSSESSEYVMLFTKVYIYF